MNKHNFILNDNIELLWELIVDTDIVKHNLNNIVKIKEIFNYTIPIFYDNEKQNAHDLLFLNKKFISVIINKIKEKEIITIEDLQTERINNFDKELFKIKNDFENHNKITIPPAPNFSDTKDSPLEEMHLIIQQTIAQRKFDVEQIIKENNVNNKKSDFLKPKETSIKKEKEIQNKNNELKYIKIDNNELENTIINKNVIDLTNQPLDFNKHNINNETDTNKHISWGENVINYIDDNKFHYNSDVNSNLKRIKTVQDFSPLIDTPELNIDEKLNLINDKIDILTNLIKNILDHSSINQK